MIETQGDAGKLGVKREESLIKQQDADTRRAELMLQRDALLNQIISQGIDQKMAEGKNEVSRTGTMARNKYNKVPYEVG